MSKSYQEEISKFKNLTIENVIKVCKECVPKEYSGHPNRHPEINHGISLLESEEALDCYMVAYGEMHRIKCLAALQNFPFEQLKSSTEIVDWACGQGIGSLCVVEELRMRTNAGGGQILFRKNHIN